MASLVRGVAYLAKEHQASGLFLGHSVTHNLTAASLDKHTRAGRLDFASERTASRTLTAHLDIHAHGGHLAATLTGDAISEPSVMSHAASKPQALAEAA